MRPDDWAFRPGLTVRATLVDNSGNEVGTHGQPFLWHPWLCHCGRNWTVPGEGPTPLGSSSRHRHSPVMTGKTAVASVALWKLSSKACTSSPVKSGRPAAPTGTEAKRPMFRPAAQ